MHEFPPLFQWAKIVIALERAISQEKAKDYLYMYSIPLGGGGDGGEESLGVMVIKSKDKTKAKQRKGALSNWKRVGRVTIDALKRRGVSGEFLRREMWGLQTAASTPVKGPAKKKGYGNFLGTDTGPGTVDILGDALDQTRFAADGVDVDPDNEMDGFGALTGAIDQLAFTHDLDFSGDGVDDDPLKPRAAADVTGAGGHMRGSMLGPPAALQAKKKLRKKKELDGHDNPAFLDDEELLLAATLGTEGPGAESDDSDTDMLEARRLAQPRIVIQAETAAVVSGVGAAPTAAAKGKATPKPAGTAAAKDAKKTPTPAHACPGNPGAAPPPLRQDQEDRFSPQDSGEVHDDFHRKRQMTADGQGAAPSDAADKGKKEGKDKPKDKDKDKIKDSAKEDKPSVVEEEPAAEEEDESGDKWAEKKPRRSTNKVAPSDSVESGAEGRARDDLSVGLQSGADTTREEVKAKERERPKTSVASQKMKKRATDDVGNMNSILPWDNEDGDIK
ncbi:hypothetical protein O3P69_008986 [Scylla paramamosain]|uniref:Uncharacterized protein n=1 Tax=Scylla paramamosain TaxID=85552 RepID=A0AAW0TSM6_SCYPA